MKEYVIEVNWKNSKAEDVFSVIHIPYKKKMSKAQIEEMLKIRFVNVISWKII